MPLLLTGYEPFISYCCIYNGYIYYHGVKCSLAFQHKIAFRQKMIPRVYVMRENNIGDKSTRQHRAQTKDCYLCLCCFSCQEFVKMHCDRNVAFIDPDAFIERGEREREDLATDPASSDMASKCPLVAQKAISAECSAHPAAYMFFALQYSWFLCTGRY